jgi:putative membrane protein
MPMMYWYGYGWGGALLMLLSMLLWVVVFALIVWALIRWLAPSVGSAPRAPTSGVSAMDILRERYARGEIDAATFDQMRERLQGSSARSNDPQAIH